MLTSIIIFTLTYVLISGRRLYLIRIGRPAGVLLGAVLMVFFGVIGPQQAYALVNWDTIILLLGMMVITEHLAETGFFDLAVSWLQRRQFGPAGLLAVLVFGSGILSTFLVNDNVCVFFTPLLVLLLRRRALPPLPFLVALATSSKCNGADWKPPEHDHRCLVRPGLWAVFYVDAAHRAYWSGPELWLAAVALPEVIAGSS